MIACEIPVSQREWVQWIGRTARNDRNGQHSIMLSATDEPVREALSSGLLSQTEYASKDGPPMYNKALIDQLLALRDVVNRQNLLAVEKEALGGNRLNEL